MTAQTRQAPGHAANSDNATSASVTNTTLVVAKPTRPAPAEATALLPEDGDYSEWDNDAFRRWIDAGGIS